MDGGRKDAMMWNYFVIYGPYGYKWLAKGWRMALVYALSKKQFTYLESFLGGADGMYSRGGQSNWRIWAAFCRALRRQNSIFCTISK